MLFELLENLLISALNRKKSDTPIRFLTEKKSEWLDGLQLPVSTETQIHNPCVKNAEKGRYKKSTEYV